MNELSNKTYVILTRNTGKFLVTKEQAVAVVNMINSARPQKIIQIGEDICFATNDFVHAVPAWKSDEIEREKSGQWKCTQSNWHGKFDVCKCGWGMDTSNTKSIDDKELTEEQKDRGRIIKLLINRGHKLVNIGKKTTKELLELEKSSAQL